MSIFFQFTFTSSKLFNKNVKFKEKILHHSKLFLSRNILTKETSENITSTNKSFMPFQQIIQSRRAEARKSMIIQVLAAQSYKELYSYCSSFGTIKQMFHYTTVIEPKHFILVEFKKESDALAALSSSTFLEDVSIAPVNSPFMWFRASTKTSAKYKSKNVELAIENGTRTPSNDEIRERLKTCDTISSQIQTLYDMSKLTDLESRLRFLTARQIELAISGMFPHAQVLPFGSSVNGFGKMGCDLDVVITLSNKKEDEGSRLVFQSKETMVNDRNLEAFGDLIQLFLPGCEGVRKILQARVPIVKYYHKFTDVECDISMSNMSGVHMSDFLYMMGALDNRVRPLVFAVRKWAHEVGLTNNSPGRWITNFSLTLLVLSFLQSPLHSRPILPSLNTLVKSAESKDFCITKENVNCTFLRDIEKLHYRTENLENLEELLCEFFEYYSQFDFQSKSVCLNEAVPLTKPDYSPLYIVNPLERGLNVSKNVSSDELRRFKKEAENAAWLLQSTDNSKLSNWGLLSIFDNKKATSNGRIMHVKELFEEEEHSFQSYDKLNIKNNGVKKIEIKKDSLNQLKKLKHSKNTNS